MTDYKTMTAVPITAFPFSELTIIPLNCIATRETVYVTTGLVLYLPGQIVSSSVSFSSDHEFAVTIVHNAETGYI